MLNKNKVRWGIIGCGNVTEHKSGPGLQKAEGSELVAVMRRDRERAADYAKRHGVARWYDDAGQLIADPEVDAVYVATPPSTHCEYAIMAMRAGKPVYVEKPMALNVQECERMLQVSQETGMPLFVAYYRRALPRFQQVREWIESGAIGEVRTVRTWHHAPPLAAADVWRVNPQIAGGGLYVDLASHTLDLLDDLLGPIHDCHGQASNSGAPYAAEDTVSMQWRFGQGAHGIGTWCFNAYAYGEETEITGSQGSITFATYSERPVVLRTSAGTSECLIANPEHIQQPLIQSVVNELLGRGQAASTGYSAMRTTRIMEEVLRSYYANAGQSS